VRVKMIATDLDGTLLRSDSTMSEYTKSVLENCRAKGIKIVPATARSSIIGVPQLINLADGLVLNNGATVYVDGKLIYNRAISTNDIRAFLSTLNSNGIKLMTENNGTYYANFNVAETWAVEWIKSYESVDFNMLNVEMCHLFAIADTVAESRLAESIINKYLPNDLHLLVREESRLMVILHKEAMKAKGTAALADYWGIDSFEIVAFGDDTIDIDLLEFCGVGVAVSNALDEVKAVADYVCDSNNGDGVARWLEERENNGGRLI